MFSKYLKWGFPKAIFLALAGAQTCLLFENGLMVSCKGQKEQILMSYKGFGLLSILISNAIHLKGK